MLAGDGWNLTGSIKIGISPVIQTLKINIQHVPTLKGGDMAFTRMKNGELLLAPAFLKFAFHVIVLGTAHLDVSPPVASCP